MYDPAEDEEYKRLLTHYTTKLYTILDEDASLIEHGSHALSNACAQFAGDIIGRDAPPAALIQATFMAATVLTIASVGVDTALETEVRTLETRRFAQLALIEGTNKFKFLSTCSDLWDQVVNDSLSEDC